MNTTSKKVVVSKDGKLKIVFKHKLQKVTQKKFTVLKFLKTILDAKI